MTEITVLVVDDVEDTAKTYAHWIELALERVLPGIEIKVDPCFDINRAQEIAESDELDLLVTDIVWELDGRKRNLGLPLIRGARDAHQEDLAIVAISGESAKGLDKARKLGADETLSKAYLEDEGADPELLGSTLLRALKKNGFDVGDTGDLRVVPAHESLAWTALLQWIGVEVLARLIHGLIGPGCTEARVSLVRPGLSGAVVLGVECSMKVAEDDKQPGFARRILLKLARDRELIVGEHEVRNLNTRRFPQGLFPRVQDDLVAEAGGWTAISQEFVPDATTLSTWLGARSPPPGDVTEALEDLFSVRDLKNVYLRQVTLEEDLRRGEAIRQILGNWRGAKVLEALSEICELVDSLRSTMDHPLPVFEGRRLGEFVQHGRIFSFDAGRHSKGATFVRSHGDLHASNVLVGRKNRLVLIDPANIEVLPWPGDFARLSVDIFLSCYAAGPKAHFWGDMGLWLSTFNAIFIDDIDQNVQPVDSAQAAIIWLRELFEELRQEQGVEVERWEILLAVTAELLRGCYRAGELPAPKRVLAALCAYRALETTSSLLGAT